MSFPVLPIPDPRHDTPMLEAGVALVAGGADSQPELRVHLTNRGTGPAWLVRVSVTVADASSERGRIMRRGRRTEEVPLSEKRTLIRAGESATFGRPAPEVAGNVAALGFHTPTVVGLVAYPLPGFPVRWSTAVLGPDLEGLRRSFETAPPVPRPRSGDLLTRDLTRRERRLLLIVMAVAAALGAVAFWSLAISKGADPWAALLFAALAAPVVLVVVDLVAIIGLTALSRPPRAKPGRPEETGGRTLPTDGSTHGP